MKTLIDAWKERYPKVPVAKLAAIFEDANQCAMTWDNITKVNLDAWVQWLLNVRARNSAQFYCKSLKAILGLYSDEITLPKGYEQVLTVRGEGTVSTWLTEEDIDYLTRVELTSENEQIIRAQFLIGCLTGARHSDYERFTSNNIVGDSLVYVAQKTKIRTEVPIAPIVRRLLSHYDLAKTFTQMTFNRAIQRICEKAGIDDEVQVYRGGEAMTGPKYQFVSSHTARRSFATNVYLRCHDIFMVCRYMGHSSVDMTAKYILSIGDAPAEVRQYFEQFR